MTRRIVTSYFRVPGPAPQFDWTAFYEGTEETGPYGSGATPQQAINDLVENYETEYGGGIPNRWPTLQSDCEGRN